MRTTRATPLVAWEKVQLLPGQGKTVTLTVSPDFFHVQRQREQKRVSAYEVFVCVPSESLPLTRAVAMESRSPAGLFDR